jgi:hypothetical protein
LDHDELLILLRVHFNFTSFKGLELRKARVRVWEGHGVFWFSGFLVWLLVCTEDVVYFYILFSQRQWSSGTGWFILIDVMLEF